MRPGMLVTLAGSWLVLSVMTQPLAGAARQASAQTAPADKVPILKVEGRWQSTVTDAWSSDQRVAQENLQREADRIAAIVGKIELLTASGNWPELTELAYGN